MCLRNNIVRSVLASGLLMFVVLFLHLSLESCSRDEKSKRESVQVPFSISKTNALALEDSESLDLVSNGTNIQISVSGCSSGFTYSTAGINSGAVNLYKGDQNCLVKLQSFVFGTTTYSATATGATNFTTWTPGSMATFANVSSSTDLINVFINTQVTSTGVLVTDTVSYNFTDVTATTTQNLNQASVSTPVPLSVSGAATPSFTMTQAVTLLLNANGSANMTFTLQCSSALTGSTLPTYACGGAVLQTQLDYILIADAYSQGAITEGQANAAFIANTPTAIGSLIIPTGGVDLYNNTLANGGFYTSTSSPLVTGSVSIYPSNRNYVFMIRRKDVSGNVTGYLYFYVNFPTTLSAEVSGCGTTFAGGAGTLTNPYQIANAYYLANTVNCTSSTTYFIQTNNFDLGGAATPWTPIQLYGQYNGNGKTISNLYVSGGTATNVGLFSIINSGASISSLTLSSVNISGGQYIGALAAQMSGGTVTSVSASGTLAANSISTGTGIVAGGLIGSMTTGTVSSSSSSVSITYNPSTTNTGSMYFGGLIASIVTSTSNATLTNCFATGSITASGATSTNAGTSYFGGMIAYASTTGSSVISVSQSYATGALTLNYAPTTSMATYMGGFIGVATSVWPSNVTLSKNFATGALSFVHTANTGITMGGFAGAFNNETANNNYSMGSITLTGSGSGGAIGGFVGASASGSAVSTSYSAAASINISGLSVNQGAFQDNSDPLTASNDYYYASGSVGTNSYSGVTGLSSAQMIVQSNFTGFDFSTPIWRMPSANPLSPGGLLSPVFNWQCGSNGITCI